ncbi:helix-turn-helix domain-containing protein [Streptacidiphilus melanogenes]|uniref:helix-turn-helix domain-containing protein n=1 Tax=Streptacidiphilus melanogenes TaxID=411235 RepID=UPI000AE81757|nr:helix-turn-helix transcriptional regulator [Streptacidiphilus melanogenes]
MLFTPQALTTSGGSEARPRTDDRSGGPFDFDVALREAIAERGLTLERIADRLRARGITLSVATLSFWQNGRCRPERARSLVALAAVEEVLRQPPGALSALLGPPRPRGRRTGAASCGTPLSEVWTRDGQDPGLWHALDTRWDLTLSRLSCHSRLNVDAERRQRSLWNRRLLRAEGDGADRWIAVLRADPAATAPEVEVAGPCRLGTVVHAVDHGLLAAEILFDRPLVRGESVIVEYTAHWAPAGPPVSRLGTRLNRRIRERLLEVRFDPAAQPRSCHVFRSTAVQTPPQERLLRLDRACTVHAVALGAGPGRFGIRWEWE